MILADLYGETNIPDNTTIDDMRRHIADGDNNYDDSSNDREVQASERGEDPRVMHVFKGRRGFRRIISALLMCTTILKPMLLLLCT